MPGTSRARRALALLGSVVLALSLSACTPDGTAAIDLPDQVDASLPQATQTQLSEAVDRAVAASGSSGAIVGVWVPWSGTWLRGVGTTAPNGGKVQTDATFKVGAVTRAMTCDLLYALAHRGTVALDDSVTTYVPGLPEEYADITLTQLCDSTSGLASYYSAISARVLAAPTRNWNPRELLAYGMARTETAEPSTHGTKYASSDTGYVLLGIALENATHRDIDDLLADDVFAPSGMTSSALPATATAGLRGLLAPVVDGKVDCAAPVDVTAVSPSATFTSGGVVADLTDLGRYVQGLATGARAYDAEGRFADPKPVTDDAPAWFTATGGAFQAGTLIGQYGSTPGYLTAAFADRNTGMAVVVVLNDSRASSTLVRSLAWELASIASKAPAASGQTAPEAGLPWTAEAMAAAVADAAVCPIP